MKYKLIFLFLLTIFSCSKKAPVDAKLFIDSIQGENNSEFYLFVINSNSCIRCCPGLILSIKNLDEKGISKEQVHLVLNEVREVNREFFFNENFGISSERFTCYYNTELNNNLTRHFDMPLNMFGVKFSGDSIQTKLFKDIR